MAGDRGTARRAAAVSVSYVDLTFESDNDEAETHRPLQTSQKHNRTKKVKPISVAHTLLTTQSPSPQEDSSSSEGEAPGLGEEEYEVEYIVDSRFRSYGGKPVFEYLIHWQGYPISERSWTLGSQLDEDDPPVLEFHKKYPKKPRRNQRTVLDLLRSGPAPAARSKAAAPKATSSKDTKATVKDTKATVKDTKATGKVPTIQAAKPRSLGKENQRVPAKRARSVSDDDFKADDGSESEPEASDVDDAPSEPATPSEDEVDERPVKSARKTHGGWGAGPKAPKKPQVTLHNFRTNVAPLQMSVDLKTAAKQSAEDLPPINDVEAMFENLNSRLPAIEKIATRLNGRKLRVATMCSGTESPLLALNMLAKAAKTQSDISLEFDHVFSCEIEPFKQAYIERNFAPPILFRDVTELGSDKAHTAYGSLVDVPGNVDILIAGTSCVDYSGLNNEKQGIDANGESGRTFRGMIQWVQKHQPPIVILENVCSAPWDRVVEYFAEIDYDAQYTRLDTKEFYIPHTRTRVYLFATPVQAGNKQHLAQKWATTVRDLRRPWSSSFEAFLLPPDDVNIHRTRLDVTAARFAKDGTQRKATDWGRCESRHARARQEEGLGVLRPLTSWQEAGVCKGLDWTWNDWLLGQTERVVDLLEISTLRMAKDGIDAGFKACIWNVSQNVDRQTGSSKTALAPCLTPNMIPWVTNRGGPVTGREALALQGIPVSELLLTSENEDQLADLAGNAMTTTVVGASMLAALYVAAHTLPEGDDAMTEAHLAAVERERETIAAASRIVGEDSLVRRGLDLAKVAKTPLAEILDLAERSSRHCACEGQSGTAPAPVQICEACGYRSCQTCGGRPEHVYAPYEDVRVEPSHFEKQFKNMLPMRVTFSGLTADVLDAAKRQAEKDGKGQVKSSDWTKWSQAVLDATHHAEFRFRYLKRQNIWTAVYESPSASLDLWLQSPTPEWRLTIKPPAEEPANSRLRQLLLQPAARMRLSNKSVGLLHGAWELCVPSDQTFDVEIGHAGEMVPSWQASLGLQDGLQDTWRWSKYKITVPEATDRVLDRPLSGVYSLLPQCGQAMSSLHVKEEADDGQPRMYFFFDPSRSGEAADDRFVFSTNIERLDYNVERDIVASVDRKWRETVQTKSDKKRVAVHVRGGWVQCPETRLVAIGDKSIATKTGHGHGATVSIPPSAQAVSSSAQDCQHATAILSASVPLDPSHSEPMWPSDTWGEVDLQHNGNTTFSNLAWITERLPSLKGFSSWTQLPDVEIAGAACSQCAPRPPTIHWIKQAGKPNKNGHKTKSTIFPFEDRKQAGRYEHALKNRPAPFVLQLRLDDSLGTFRIGLNIMSLAHRALSRLPKSKAKGAIHLSWRLTTGLTADVPEPPRVFVLPSNKRDPQHAQPSGFLLPLRKEQLRSLWWMISQERAEGKTHTFVEEEISEAQLPALGWRGEGKAERPVMVRGGVIADQVGYGKTIISLALIAETMGQKAPEASPPGLIDSKATLIVVPGHLSKQWPSEIARFTGSLFKTIVLQTVKDLQQTTIADFKAADVIVVASELFESEVYWQRFEYLSAQPDGWLGDKNGGRFFADQLDAAMLTLNEQVQSLQEGGTQAALECRAALHKRAINEAESKKDELKAANFGKRLKGAAYRDKYDADTHVNKKAKASSSKASPEDDDGNAEDSELLMAKPTFRPSSGAESLSGPAAAKNFNRLACPVLHMFRFRRVIADEFTYLEKRGLASLFRLSSSCKWVLSGTPPVNDFPAVRSLASFMGIHLGVEDDSEGSAQLQKARAKEQTAAEKFHAFREVHSASWHRRRDDLAQEFLDIFVRQNIAEIEDIPTLEHIHNFRLPASEGAVYLELEHHLQALEMQARKETKFKNVSQGDRNARLEEALADSRTAEEALLKRCCHFTLDLSDKKHDAKTAIEACDHIASARRKQLEGCEEDLRKSINIGVGLNAAIRKRGGFTKEDQQPFRDWVQFSFDETKHQGDAEAAQRLVEVLRRCNFTSTSIPSEPADVKAAKVDAKPLQDVKWDLREHTHLLRRLSKELVARVRSLRFFDVVRKLQRNGADARKVLASSACGHQPSAGSDLEMAVLSCCGHVACYTCMVEAANSQRCVKGNDCHAAVRHTNIVKVSSLGIEGELHSGRYGAKLELLVKLINSIPRRERVLVFLQWDDLATKVSDALNAGGIKHVSLAGGGVKARANKLDAFQSSDVDTNRVLLLKINDASAAGSNLTTANHAIFIGPLFTNTLLNYRAVETQAIGRIRRFGQSRTVHVHRLLALDTIDVSIYQTRLAEQQAKADYVEIPQTMYDPVRPEGQDEKETKRGRRSGA
ncbi:DNA (cytosine-5-)-methyltransferase dmt5 [Vanrija albida]|uniref:DNA (Cytosine-5-)-methyltransferase dmt5 n=1 Tax=Vanrija albida TaxID=181172 RepID=A0ABR3PY21_9TREE